MSLADARMHISSINYHCPLFDCSCNSVATMFLILHANTKDEWSLFWLTVNITQIEFYFLKCINHQFAALANLHLSLFHYKLEFHRKISNATTMQKNGYKYNLQQLFALQYTMLRITCLKVFALKHKLFILL